MLGDLSHLSASSSSSSYPNLCCCSVSRYEWTSLRKQTQSYCNAWQHRSCNFNPLRNRRFLVSYSGNLFCYDVLWVSKKKRETGAERGKVEEGGWMDGWMDWPLHSNASSSWILWFLPLIITYNSDQDSLVAADQQLRTLRMEISAKDVEVASIRRSLAVCKTCVYDVISE